MTQRRSPFNVGGSRIPGTLTGVGGVSGIYPMPPFGSIPLRGMRPSPDPRLKGSRAPVQSRQALAAAAGATFPPGKRPRGNPIPPGRRPPPMVGRGITPSLIMSAVTAANRSEASWRTGDKTHDFISIQRLVQADKSQLAFALALKGQFVFNDKAGFQESGRGVIVPTHHRLGGRLPAGMTGRKPAEGITRLLSLPVLNYHLRMDDEIRGAGANTSWISPEDVLERYRPEGIVRTDAHESQHQAFRNTDVKEYTVTVHMRDPNATNIWGLLRQQQPLYLIIKRIRASEAPNEYVISPIDGIRRSVPVAGAGRRFHRNPIQVVPWTDPHKRHPTLEDLQYYDELDGTTRYGIAICVGYSNYPSDSSSSQAVARAWYDASVLMELERADVTLNIRRKKL